MLTYVYPTFINLTYANSTYINLTYINLNKTKLPYRSNYSETSSNKRLNQGGIQVENPTW